MLSLIFLSFIGFAFSYLCSRGRESTSGLYTPGTIVEKDLSELLYTELFDAYLHRLFSLYEPPNSTTHKEAVRGWKEQKRRLLKRNDEIGIAFRKALESWLETPPSERPEANLAALEPFFSRTPILSSFLLDAFVDQNKLVELLQDMIQKKYSIDRIDNHLWQWFNRFENPMTQTDFDLPKPNALVNYESIKSRILAQSDDISFLFQESLDRWRISIQ